MFLASSSVSKELLIGSISVLDGKGHVGDIPVDDAVAASRAERAAETRQSVADARERLGPEASQAQVAAEVGVTNRHVRRIESGHETSTVDDSCPPTQVQRAAASGISRASQATIDAIAKVDPELAERAQNGDVPIKTAAKMAGVIKPADKVETAKKALAKLSPEERANVIANSIPTPNGDDENEQGRQRPDQSQKDHGRRDGGRDRTAEYRDGDGEVALITARDALRRLPVSEALAALETLRQEFGAQAAG